MNKTNEKEIKWSYHLDKQVKIKILWVEQLEVVVIDASKVVYSFELQHPVINYWVANSY